MQHALSRLSESMPWLDKAAETLKSISEPLVGPEAPRSLRNALYGTWLGHPLHPAVTDVPIGAWTATTVLDALGHEKAADASLKLGVLGAAGSAVTGVAQWYDLQEMKEPRRLGALHASLNTAALGLYLTSWMLRNNGNRRGGVATALAGYSIAGVSAWIGGDLSYRLGIGVSRVAFEEPGRKWRDAISLEELPDGTPKRIDVRGMPVMLLKQGDDIYAASATCTHVGGPLDEGEVDGPCVTCPWHGSVFDLRDGTVVHGPATAPIHAFETRIHEGGVQVRARAT